MTKWTTPQKNAIEARDSNILVSAAAGSGKTAVLVERVIQLITDVNLNVDVVKLLIVTFTNAAAAEMKSRIAKALLKIIKENQNDTNAHRQHALLPNAKISTIDSFCIGLVRENFFKLDIEQDFKILDNSENAVLEKTAMDEVLDFLYENGGEDFAGDGLPHGGVFSFQGPEGGSLCRLRRAPAAPGDEGRRPDGDLRRRRYHPAPCQAGGIE